MSDLSDDEISIIRTLFDGLDIEREGKIHINQLPSLLNRLEKPQDDVILVVEQASRIADENEGRIRFDDIINILKRLNKSRQVVEDGPDPKVLQFLAILEEYRIKCEEEGNYLEAARANKQLDVLRRQEEKRQQKVIQARHISEKQDVQLAHNMQFAEFTKSWDKYLEEYDAMAQSYIQQMTERHALILLEFQKRVREELANKPPKWSKELLDQRRKQHINARNKNYSMAQKLKKISDQHEEKERQEMEQAQAIIFARREAKFRIQQQTELTALLKRIEARRKEHIKQRELDTKRLLQRNRNVQAVLESKQAAECQKSFADIKKLLFSSSVLQGANAPENKRSKSINNNNAAAAGSGGLSHSQSYDNLKGKKSQSNPPPQQQQQYQDQQQFNKAFIEREQGHSYDRSDKAYGSSSAAVQSSYRPDAAPSLPENTNFAAMVYDAGSQFEDDSQLDGEYYS